MKKVAVALSGGIDSAVTAYLLKQQGYKVTGVFLRLTENQPPYSPSNIAKLLKIDYIELDLKDIFKKEIIKPFIETYLLGKTPNPCIWCNQKIKFGILLKEIKKMGFDFLATGHYARKIFKNNRFILLRGIDQQRDQSYFLFPLTQEQLPHILWPLGTINKEKTKKIAINIGLSLNTKESREICFIPERNYRLFLEKHAKERLTKEGKILNLEGKVIGKHSGIWRYTIGQRHGLGIRGREAYYVRVIDADKNCLIVAPRQALFFKEAIVENVNFFPFDSLKEPLYVSVKIRYKQIETKALIKPINEKKVQIIFETPQFAVTPGQAAVFYQDEICVGGGWIISAK